MTETTERQLEIARQELVEVRKEYEEYSRMVSHDFIAVFRQIEGLVEVVSNKHAGEWDEKTLHHMDLVTKASSRGKALVERLRKFARINRYSMTLAPLNPQKIVDEVIESLDGLVKQISAAITIDLPESIRADKDLFHELIFQLLHNALNYRSAEEKPRIALSAEDKGGDWEFCVTDNGIGIPENSVDNVFSLLKRGVSQNDYPGGSGVGLAIAQKIVTNHGGEIWVERDVPSGTVVRFSLPK